MSSRVPDDRSRSGVRQGRRAWLAAVLRWVSLSVLGLISGRLILRGGHCTQQLPCQSCGLIVRCELPRAEAARQDTPRSM